MNYCFNYNLKTKNFKCLKEAQEIIIPFNKKIFFDIEKFLLENENKRVNINLEDEDLSIYNINFFNELYHKYNHKNFSLKLPIYKEKYEEIISKIEVPFFFSNLVGDWDTFIGLINYKISDIYIVEELGFELEKIKKICENKNIKIRVFPNVAQSKWKNTNALLKFFIRPEDLDFYSKYIDIIEFFGKEEKYDIYYKIYNKDKKWFGKLNEIIIDFNSELDNKYVIPRFPERRINCNKKCMKENKCKICFNIKELSNVLEQTELIVKIDKKIDL